MKEAHTDRVQVTAKATRMLMQFAIEIAAPQAGPQHAPSQIVAHLRVRMEVGSKSFGRCAFVPKVPFGYIDLGTLTLTKSTFSWK